ncbi:MAG TPA: ferredoxin-thioredoxin reductase catalytic domain-containing protein [bacterium]|nr:ferredoxin-thioredoxin reductase catalytic domain-containing protein [bacterium]
MSDPELTEKARELMERLDRQARQGGYHLNPDREMTLMLCEGLVTNLERYGYMGCPCRLMEGGKFKDLDLICPCDYRDPDLFDFGTCYCALYVTRDVVDGKRETGSIPERRGPEEERKAAAKKRRADPASAGVKVWRCKVCGYLCAREHPPEVCPVCFAMRDRFELFPLTAKEPPKPAPPKTADGGGGGPE